MRYDQYGNPIMPGGMGLPIPPGDMTMQGILAAGGVPGLMQPGSGIPVPGSMDDPFDQNPWPTYGSPLMSSGSSPPTMPLMQYTPPDPKDVAVTGFDELDHAMYQGLFERLDPRRLEDLYAGIGDNNWIREDVLEGSTGSPGALPPHMQGRVDVTPPGMQAYGGPPSSITDIINRTPTPSKPTGSKKSAPKRKELSDRGMRDLVMRLKTEVPASGRQASDLIKDVYRSEGLNYDGGWKAFRSAALQSVKDHGSAVGDLFEEEGMRGGNR